MQIEMYTLAQRDTKLTEIEKQIQIKRNLLIERKKTLEKTNKQNNFLEGVKNDYQKYYNYITKQKEDQVRSMNVLKQYIGDIMASGQLTEKEIHRSKVEQEQILREMDKIKMELDNIIQE
jgi:Rps23 Pro-64 3,4-dihydroxylase Tpa1-like proline 4-hydroxylase